MGIGGAHYFGMVHCMGHGKGMRRGISICIDGSTDGQRAVLILAWTSLELLYSEVIE